MKKKRQPRTRKLLRRRNKTGKRWNNQHIRDYLANERIKKEIA